MPITATITRPGGKLPLGFGESPLTPEQAKIRRENEGVFGFIEDPGDLRAQAFSRLEAGGPEGLLAKLRAREEFLKPTVSLRAFDPVAERGFGLSDFATDQIQRALADLEHEFTGKEENLITKTIADIQEEIDRINAGAERKADISFRERQLAQQASQAEEASKGFFEKIFT